MSSPGPEELATLLAMLAHDLRNPLAALLTNINFARTARSAHGREVEAALSDAALSCAVLTQLIGNIDVLSVAMVQAERQSLRGDRAESVSWGMESAPADI